MIEKITELQLLLDALAGLTPALLVLLLFLGFCFFVLYFGILAIRKALFSPLDPAVPVRSDRRVFTPSTPPPPPARK